MSSLYETPEMMLAIKRDQLDAANARIITLTRQRDELACFLREAATADEHIHGTEWCQGIRALLAAQEKAGG